MTGSGRPDVGGISPSSAVGGATDVRLVLALWVARRATFPLLWFGFAIASIVIIVIRHLGVDELTAELEQVSNGGNLFQTLLSPFAGIAFAVVWRLGIAWIALAVTYPLARRHRLARTAGRSQPSQAFRSSWDRWFLMRAYRAMRWTWAVRAEATAIDPRAGRLADISERFLRWSGWILLGVVISIFAFLA